MKKIFLSILMILLLPMGAFAINYVVNVSTPSVNVTLGNTVEAVYTLSTSEICNVNETNVATVFFNVGFANHFNFSGCNGQSVQFTPRAQDVGENRVTINVIGEASDFYNVSGAELTVYVETPTVTSTPEPTSTPIPSIIAPDDITAEATGITTNVDLGNATVNNTSEIPKNNAPAGFFKGITYVIWSFLNFPSITDTQTVTIVDTTKPIITLKGSNPQIMTIGTPYVEYNATVTDNYDTNLTPTIVSNVNNSTSGSYTVTYDAVDSSGNSAIQKIRSVEVVPLSLSITAPADIINIEATGNKTFVALGNPIVTGNTTAAINNAPNGSLFNLGTTVVLWSVSNSTATMSASQNITVIDTTKPLISLIGDNPQIMTIATPYVEYNAIVTDNHDTNLIPTIVSNVNNSTLGSFTVTYDAIDSSGNSAIQKIRTVKVVPVSLSITAPADIINIVATGNKTFVALGNPVVAGNTTVALNNAPNGSLFNIGKTVVLWSISNSTATMSASQNITVIDTTKPVINITSPTNRYYTPLQNVTVNFSCSDFGTTSCVGTSVNGSKLDTNSETGISGRTFTVTATDNSGNSNSTQLTYYVAKAKVMITFDDGWASVGTTAYPIMQANGQAGVAFVYPAVNNSQIIGVGSDFMTPAQLDALYLSGWDISSHTYNHINLTTVNSTVLNYELSRSKAWLEAQGYTRSSIFLAYPEGSFNSAVIAATKANNFIAARTVNPSTDYARLNNVSGDALFNLTSYEIEGGITTGIMVTNEIDTMLSKGGLLILTFHKIVPALSTNANDATTEFTTADFTTVSNYLKTKANAGQLDVVTMSTYFNTPVLPPVPVTTNISAVNIVGNFWINWTFQKRLNTDTLIVFINGTEKQNGPKTFYNATGLKPHEIVNISVRGYNQSTNTYSNWTNDTQTVPNNPLQISGIDAVYLMIAGTNRTLTTLSKDADNDTILFTTNATPTLGTINKSTGIFVLNTSAGSQGIYNWTITGNDSHGSTHTLNFTVFIQSPNQTQPYLAYNSGNFWINWLFAPGMSNDELQIFKNGTKVEYGNATSLNYTNLAPHTTMNISIRGLNRTSNTYSNWTNGTVTLANNPLEIMGMDAVYSVIAGTNHTITILSSDADNDTILFTTNATPSLGTINKSTGIFVLNASAGSQGMYNWNITGNDGYGSTKTINFTVLIESPVQTNPYLSNTTGNFWINWSFAPGMNTDDLQVFINGTKVEYGNATSLNYTDLAPHTSMNISITGYNRTGNTYSNWTNDTITLANNPVVIYDGVWAEYDVFVGDTLRIRPVVSNIENDTITFATNASLKESNVTLNNTNGEFEINPKSGDQGIYHWYILASDGFGSIDVVNTTIYITTKPNIDVGIWAQYNDLYAGDPLIIIPHITAPDNNTLTFTTNARVNSSNATINETTGAFQLNTTDGDQGTYHWYIAAHDDFGFIIVTNFSISIVTRPPPISCCNIGGGGGGGGGANIYDPNEAIYERRDSYIRKDVFSTVTFNKNTVVSNVSFYGLRNYGDVTVKIALLKENPTSNYIDNAYKFFAINLLSIKQQEENLFISNTTVTVQINKTNLSDNTMKAYRFENDTWIPIVAEELPMDDNGSKYYNLISDGLSNFAIVLEPKYSNTIEPEELQLSTIASIIPQIETSSSEMISKIQESLYRQIINWIKKYMWWV